MEKKNLWTVYDESQLNELEKLNVNYKSYLDNGKTERECIAVAVKMAEEAGYKINSIKCEVDEETLEPKSLRLEIETEDGVVQPVRIEVSNNSISNKKEVILSPIRAQTHPYRADNTVLSAPEALHGFRVQ